MTTADALAPKVDWDLLDGKVNIHGREISGEMLQPNLERGISEELGTAGEEESYGLLTLTRGDAFPVDVGFFYDGTPVEVDIVELRMALKEFDTSILYPLNESGEFVEVVRDGQKRYRILITLAPAKMLQILQKYSDPRGTFVYLLGELQAIFSYRLEQLDPVEALPSQADLAAGTTQTLEALLPLGLENGESKSFSFRAQCDNVSGVAMVGSQGSFRNIQSHSEQVSFTATKSGGTVTINQTSTSTQKSVEQFNPQYQAWPVWATSFAFQPLTVDGDSVKVSCQVTTAAFQHGSLTLPANAWVSDIFLPDTSHDRYGQTWRGDQQFELTSGGAGNPWSRLELLLVDGETEATVFSITSASSSGVDMAAEISTALGDVYIMAPQAPFGGSAASLRNHFQLLFPTQPTASVVRVRVTGSLWTGDDAVTDYPIVGRNLGNTSPFRLTAEIPGQPDSSSDELQTPKSTQRLAFKLSKDLIPVQESTPTT